MLRMMITFIAFLSGTAAAVACPDGYARDSFGFCEPTGRTVEKTGSTALQQSFLGPIDVVKHMSQGDMQGVYASLGKFIVEGPNCVGCGEVAKQALGEQGKERLEALVGHGALILGDVFASDEPVLLSIDPVSKQITKNILFRPDAPPAQAGTPPTQSSVREDLSFQAVTPALCVVIKDKRVVAWWSSIPQLKNSKTGSVNNLWDSGIRPGDTIFVDAGDCSEQNNSAMRQSAMLHVVMEYSYEAPVHDDKFQADSIVGKFVSR